MIQMIEYNYRQLSAQGSTNLSQHSPANDSSESPATHEQWSLLKLAAINTISNYALSRISEYGLGLPIEQLPRGRKPIGPDPFTTALSTFCQRTDR
jgi:hypothetical protein